MRIIHAANELKPAGRKVCLAIGFFDGVHLGHQQIIRQTITDARQHEAIALVITFDRHPNTVVAPSRVPPLVYSLPQKLRAIEYLGADTLLLVHFDKVFSEQTGEGFIRGLARDLGHVQSLCVGVSFVFGHKRGGNVSAAPRYHPTSCAARSRERSSDIPPAPAHTNAARRGRRTPWANPPAHNPTAALEHSSPVAVRTSSHCCGMPSDACDGLAVAWNVAWWQVTHGVMVPLNCWNAACRWQSTHRREACTPSSGSRVRACASCALTWCQLDSRWHCSQRRPTSPRC
jgi:hypothetical protein